ncbi:hypothetical protein DCC85_16065 [Paenibacillus sp. CAA11]|nr:hypothetical protein DCC85_16065 [Paenibacillus sp. CAA11]
MQGITAFNYSNLLNHTNHLNSSVSTLDFQNLLKATILKAESAKSTESTKSTTPWVSAEQSLKERYPGLKYQVLDASEFKYWNRLDFPTSKLYGDKITDSTINELKSWRPKASLATGYEPWVQSDLERIPNGLHVVMIHPSVQGKMDRDPEYAKEIAAKVQKYFDDDVRLNAAIDPESVKSMSQLVTITADGEIGFHETVCDGPAKSKKKSGEDTMNEGVKTNQTNKKLGLLATESNLGSMAALSTPLNQTQTAALEYNYNYVYELYNFGLNRKTDSGFII